MYETLVITDTSQHVLRCGLVVPPTCPWVGCSPDGILMLDGRPSKLLEVKSPVCGKEQSVDLTIQSKKLDFLTYEEDGVCHLKKRHRHFSPVQLGMAIIGVDICDLIIYGKDSIALVPVHRDQRYTDMLFQSLHKTRGAHSCLHCNVRR